MTARINVDAPIGALKTQLSKLLLSVDRVGWLNGATSGRFDVRRTSRMLAGSERVFKHRTETPATTTAVSIIIDLSASMTHIPRSGANWWEERNPKESDMTSGSRIALASQCAYAIAQAVERSNCEVEVVGFGSFSHAANMSSGGLRETDGNTKARVGDSDGYATARMFTIKAYNQKAATRKGFFEVLHKAARFGTPDYHAIRTITQDIIQRSEHRKLVMVLTDGMGEPDKVKKFVKFSAKHYKTPVLGIGIQTEPDEMSMAYEQYACVSNINDLSETAISSLIEQIKKMERQH